MLVVDTSVLINNIRMVRTTSVLRMLDASLATEILVGDVVLLEILQGARDESHAARLEAELRHFRIVPMLDPRIAIEAAANFRRLRGIGITVRKTMDLIIGTYCLMHGYALLHDDRDFDQMQRHLGLRVA